MDTATSEHEPDGPLPRIRELTSRIRHVERDLSVEVRRARTAGMSWQVIAESLGVSRQAAHKKYGRNT